MQHRDYVFKWLFYSLTALAFVLLQVFVLVHVRLDSAVFVLAFGLVLDITMPGEIPCFYTVAFIVVFIVSRLLSAKVLVRPFFCCMLCGILSIVCTDLLHMLFLNAFVSFSFRSALLLMGKELLLTTPLLPLLFLPAYKIRRIFHQ